MKNCSFSMSIWGRIVYFSGELAYEIINIINESPRILTTSHVIYPIYTNFTNDSFTILIIS